MVGCEGDASPYFTCGVIDAATQGCILRTAEVAQRCKNPHSEHENPRSLDTSRTARAYGWATILPGWSGSGRSWYTGAGSRQQVLELTGAEHDIVSAPGPADQSVLLSEGSYVVASLRPYAGCSFLELRPACVHIITGSESQRDQAGRTCSTEFALASPLPPQSIHICIGRKGVRGGSAGEARRDSK